MWATDEEAEAWARVAILDLNRNHAYHFRDRTTDGCHGCSAERRCQGARQTRLRALARQLKIPVRMLHAFADRQRYPAAEDEVRWLVEHDERQLWWHDKRGGRDHAAVPGNLTGREKLAAIAKNRAACCICAIRKMRRMA